MKPKPGFGKYKLMLSLAPVVIALTFILGSCSSQNEVMTPEMEKATKALIEKTIRENPEIVIRAFQTYEAKQKDVENRLAQENIVLRAKDLFEHPDDPVGGNPKGEITLVEFFDYQCGYCKLVHKSVMKLLKEDKGIKYVYKEFPVLGPKSINAAKMALASVPQGKYPQFNDALMTSNKALTKENIAKIALEVGVDLQALKDELKNNEDKLNKIIQRNMQLASDLLIRGTPGFVIGDQIIRGAVDFDTLKSLVTDARKKNREEAPTKG